MYSGWKQLLAIARSLLLQSAQLRNILLEQNGR